jgi:hypothetical protein
VADTNSWVDAENICEVSQDLAPEVSRSGIVGPELRLEARPGDHREFLEVAHSVGEPHIVVDGEGRSLQLTDRSEIDGDGRTRDLLEEVLTQHDLGTPRGPSLENLSRRPQP